MGAGGTFDAEKAGGPTTLSSPILLSVFRFLAVMTVTAKMKETLKNMPTSDWLISLKS